MSDVLTRERDFQPVAASPSMQTMRSQTQQDASGLFLLLTLGIGLITPSPPPIAFRELMLTASNVAPEGGQQTSPSVFAKETATTARSEEFAKALSEAIELSNIMVAEVEAATLDPQTWAYAIHALLPIFFETASTPPHATIAEWRVWCRMARSGNEHRTAL